MALSNKPYFFSVGKSDLQKDEEVGEVCIANISLLERKKRLKFAIGQFVTSLVVLVVLIILDADPFWRLPLLFLFSAATVSYFQARDKT
jgi:uncharacterized membrane protein